MRKLVCLLLALALLVPAVGFAEPAATLELEGEWYVTQLYTELTYPLTRKPGSIADIPDMFLTLSGMKAPSLLSLNDGAALVYERQASGSPLLALARKEGYTWRCLYSHGSNRLVFGGGEAFDPASMQAVRYAFDGQTMSMTYGDEEISGEVVAYGEDCFELRYTDEVFESYISYGVPSLLFVRAGALTALPGTFDIGGDWWAVTLFSGVALELPVWISSMLDLTNPMASAAGTTDRMTIGDQTMMNLGDGLGLGVQMEDGEPVFIALMRRENDGWYSYSSGRIYAYRFEGSMFIDLNANGWLPCALDGDTLTVTLLSGGEKSGRIEVYNDDVFAWHNEAEEYVEDGVNYGVPWMLFVRQSVVE